MLAPSLWSNNLLQLLEPEEGSQLYLPADKANIPEDLNHDLHRYEKSKSHTFRES